MKMNIVRENLHSLSVSTNAKNNLLPNIYLGLIKACRKKK